jgi:hypothetical protein
MTTALLSVIFCGCLPKSIFVDATTILGTLASAGTTGGAAGVTAAAGADTGVVWAGAAGVEVAEARGGWVAGVA